MAWKQPLTREQHVEYCQWAEELDEMAHDAVNLLWSTYGVSSKIGRLTERLHGNLMGLWPSFESRARDFDESIPDKELRPRSAASSAVPFHERVDRPNRFAFKSIPRGRHPHQMSLDLHKQLGAELKQFQYRGAAIYTAYANAYARTNTAVTRLGRVLKTIGNLRCELDNEVLSGFKGQAPELELMYVYYGNERNRPTATGTT